MLRNIPKSFFINGKPYYVSLNIVDYDDNLSILVTLRDVSIIQELQDHKRISKFKSDILASTSHEIRNPLNGLLAMLENM